MPSNFPHMNEEYLLERLRDKDAALDDLVMSVTHLKKELLDIHDWIAEYVADQKNLLFAFEKMQARILEPVRLAPSENLS